MPRLPALAIVIALPTVALADPIVRQPEDCKVPLSELDNLPDGPFQMNTAGFSETEYHCSWEPVAPFHWFGYNVQSTYGYCEEPGFLTPQVFTLVTDENAPGEIRLFSSAGEGNGERFYDCAALPAK